MNLLFGLLLLSGLAHAQHSEQPLKESTTDLRNQLVVFSIDIPNDKKTFQLERTQGLEYFLRAKISGEETIKKIDSRAASKLDREFSSKFLRCQYELPSGPGECKVTLRLSMKGESQEICAKDDKKSQEMASLIQDLNQRF